MLLGPPSVCLAAFSKGSSRLFCVGKEMDCRRLRLEGALKLRYDQSVGRSRTLAKDMEATPDNRFSGGFRSPTTVNYSPACCGVRGRGMSKSDTEIVKETRIRKSFLTRIDVLWLTANAEGSADSTHAMQQAPKGDFYGFAEGNIVVTDCLSFPCLRMPIWRQWARRGPAHDFTTCSDEISTKPTQSNHSRTWHHIG